VVDFAKPGFRRETCVMLNSALGTPIFRDESRHFWAANRRQEHFYLVRAAPGSVIDAMPMGCGELQAADEGAHAGNPV
jgi:hypothetical protein